MAKRDGFPFNDGSSGGVSKAILLETPDETSTIVLKRGALMFFGAKHLRGDVILKDLRDALNELYPETKLKGGLE